MICSVKKAVMNQFSDSFTPSYIPAPLMITPGRTTFISKQLTVRSTDHMTPQEISSGISFEYIPETESERQAAANLDMTENQFKLLLSYGLTNGDVTSNQALNIYKIYALYTDVSAYDDKGGKMEALAKT